MLVVNGIDAALNLYKSAKETHNREDGTKMLESASDISLHLSIDIEVTRHGSPNDQPASNSNHLTRLQVQQFAPSPNMRPCLPVCELAGIMMAYSIRVSKERRVDWGEVVRLKHGPASGSVG